MSDSLVHTTKRKLKPGSNDALGATLSADGVNFAISSKSAKEIFLLLFSRPDAPATDIIKLERSNNDIWHVFVPRIKAGQLYGYKVKGDYNPAQGLRFNEHKLLMDPYGKSFCGCFRNTDNLLFGYDANSPEKDLSFDSRDDTLVAPKSVVVDDTFDWQGDRKPGIPLEKLIIYEAHIKGFTAHKSSGVKARGTYSGFVEKIPYLKSLGINAVEFLPVHQSYKRDGLTKLGLTDYWGYNSVGFFAPENSYSRVGSEGTDSAVDEFKTLVKELHAAGIEVIMDVVYNHTGEGDELGPTLCFRGIDNPSYYALRDGWGAPYRFYVNDAGCGNMLNVENPVVRRLVLDSLRYWAEVMHVDGFRFDLASILGRVNGQFSKDSAFFTLFSQDPILKNVKVIAEPWDLTTYQVGHFPKDWSEWNGKFRDNARKFILGFPGQAKELSLRLTGSADLYGDDGRSPYNSINFITCHDGFTLNDLYSYDRKHNEANAENNKDGTNENFSWNCGVEGPTEDERILRLRKQMVKNALSCLLIPLGTPMILGGDEFMRTQSGNNNAYCQDKEEIWFDWDYAKQHKDMTEFLRKIIVFRKRYTVLQQRKFLAGQGLDFAKAQGVSWYGENLDSVRWDDPSLKTFCCHLDGGLEPSSGLGRYYLFFILNADTNEHIIKIPQHENITWYRVLDTSLENGEDILAPGKEKKLADAVNFRVSPRCVAGLLGKPDDF